MWGSIIIATLVAVIAAIILIETNTQEGFTPLPNLNGTMKYVQRKVQSAHSLFRRMVRRGQRAPIDFDAVPGL